MSPVQQQAASQLNPTDTTGIILHAYLVTGTRKPTSFKWMEMVELVEQPFPIFMGILATPPKATPPQEIRPY